MSSANPPFPWFNGIKYNPAFFTSSTIGTLTKAQANALYMQKTVPDTATSIETFQAGIKTDNIDSFTGPVTMSGVDVNIGNVGITSTINNNCIDYYLTGGSAITNIANGYDVNANIIPLNLNNGSLNNNYIGSETT
jgi:hypothetical protein